MHSDLLGLSTPWRFAFGGAAPFERGNGSERFALVFFGATSQITIAAKS